MPNWLFPVLIGATLVVALVLLAVLLIRLENEENERFR